jgi:hypothetical protein
MAGSRDPSRAKAQRKPSAAQADAERRRLDEFLEKMHRFIPPVQLSDKARSLAERLEKIPPFSRGADAGEARRLGEELVAELREQRRRDEAAGPFAFGEKLRLMSDTPLGRFLEAERRRQVEEKAAAERKREEERAALRRIAGPPPAPPASPISAIEIARALVKLVREGEAASDATPSTGPSPAPSVASAPPPAQPKPSMPLKTWVWGMVQHRPGWRENKKAAAKALLPDAIEAGYDTTEGSIKTRLYEILDDEHRQKEAQEEQRRQAEEERRQRGKLDS